MTLIAPSPVMVTLLQAVSTLPIFLFALPAGALADIVDRRWLLVLVQAFMAVVAALLGIASSSGGRCPGSCSSPPS